jgi:hypothetical protein
MKTYELDERTIDAADLPDYVGWTLVGVMASDGTILWGELTAAEQVEMPNEKHGPQPKISVTYQHTVRKGVTVPDGQLVSLETPFGPHRVTVSRSVLVHE